MEQTDKKILILVGSSVVVGLLGYAIKGFYGLGIALAVYWAIILIFSIWGKKDKE